MNDRLSIFLSDDEQDSRSVLKSNKIINFLETSGFEVTYGARDFVIGAPIHDNKREAVVRNEMVVVLLSDLYIETPNCMYDVSLALCYDRHIILIDKRKSVKHIPPLLSECPKISCRKGSGKTLQRLMKLIDHYRNNLKDQVDKNKRKWRDHAQTFIRDVEREAGFDHQIGFQKKNLDLELKIERLYREKKIQTHVYICTAEDDMLDYNRELSHRVNEQKTTRKLREEIRFMKSREKSLLEKIKSLSEKNKPDRHEDNDVVIINKIQDQINEILIHIAGFKRTGNEHTCVTIPSEVRCFCEKYEKMIGPNIRRFGQSLLLSADQMDKVEEFRQYGYTEMFWQTIRLWKPTLNSNNTFRTFLNALEEVGVDIGGKPMPQAEVRVLHENIPFILQNCYRVIDLVVHLLSSHVLTEITHMYILEATGDEDRMLRLVNVLTTKENGIQLICDAFCRTDQKFIADKILDEIPQRSKYQSATEKSDCSSDVNNNSTSSDESKYQVAVVAPTSVRLTNEQQQTLPVHTMNKSNVVDSTEVIEKNLKQRVATKTKSGKMSCCIQ